MAEKKEVSFQNRVADRLSLFLAKYRKVVLISGAAIVLALIVLIIVLSVGSKQTVANQQRIDELSQQYDAWAASTDEEASLPENLVADLNDMAGTRKSKYPALKAEYLLALISADQNQWSDAKNHLETVVDNGGDTYFESLALFNLGVVSEELGDTTAAVDYYQQVYDSTSGKAAESARALLSVARLDEANGGIDLAKAVLQQLADEYPESEYAKIALSHLVLL